MQSAAKLSPIQEIGPRTRKENLRRKELRELVKEFDLAVSNPDDAMKMITNQIEFIGFLPIAALSLTERRRIVKACRELYPVLRKLNIKYND